MEEYITKQKAIDLVKSMEVAIGCTGVSVLTRGFERMGEAVVRCKDCLWYKAENGCPLKESGYFTDGKMLPLENDFCSYGERKE